MKTIPTLSKNNIKGQLNQITFSERLKEVLRQSEILYWWKGKQNEKRKRNKFILENLKHINKVSSIEMKWY